MPQLPVGTQLWVRAFEDSNWFPSHVVDESLYDLEAMRAEFPTPSATTLVEFYDEGNCALVDTNDRSRVAPLEFDSARAQKAREDPRLSDALDLARAMRDSMVQQQPQSAPAATYATGGSVTLSRVEEAHERKLMRQYLETLGNGPDAQAIIELMRSDGADLDGLLHPATSAASSRRRSRSDDKRAPVQAVRSQPAAAARIPASVPAAAASDDASETEHDDDDDSLYHPGEEEEEEEDGMPANVTDEDVASAMILRQWSRHWTGARLGIDTARHGSGPLPATSAQIAKALRLDPSLVPLTVAGIYNVSGAGGTIVPALNVAKAAVVCREALEKYARPRGAAGEPTEWPTLFCNDRPGERGRIGLVLVPTGRAGDSNPRGNGGVSPTDDPMGWMARLELEGDHAESVAVEWTVAAGTIRSTAPPNWRIPVAKSERWKGARMARALEITEGVPLGAAELPLRMYAQNARRCGIANEGLWTGAVAVLVVAKIPLETLISTVVARPPVPSRPQGGSAASAAAAVADEDDDLEAVGGTCPVSTKCPLTMARLVMPCRGVRCEHAQSVELSAYLQHCLRSGLWVCPSCSDTVTYEDIIVDVTFRSFLQTHPAAMAATLDLETRVYSPSR